MAKDSKWHTKLLSVKLLCDNNISADQCKATRWRNDKKTRMRELKNVFKEDTGDNRVRNPP